MASGGVLKPNINSGYDLVEQLEQNLNVQTSEYDTLEFIRDSIT